jgi:hypothetical protein
MKKKWWIIAAATIAGCIGLALVIPALRPPRPGVTKENFDRIEIGMTRADVEAILGEPNIWPPVWESDLGDEAQIEFDHQFRVKEKHWDEWPDDRTVYEKLLDQLPWRERPVLRRPREVF